MFKWRKNTKNEDEEKKDKKDEKEKEEEKKEEETFDYSFTLENINFEAKQGQLVGIIGRIGSGKTSLLNSILGEMEVVSGDIEVKGTLGYVKFIFIFYYLFYIFYFITIIYYFHFYFCLFLLFYF